MELDHELFLMTELEPEVEDYLRICLCVVTLGFLYVSILFHESLLQFCLVRCRRKIQRWRRLVSNLNRLPNATTTLMTPIVGPSA